MKVVCDFRSMKPAAVKRLAAGLAPQGELGRPLAAVLRQFWENVDAVLAAGGEGAFGFELAALPDSDLRRLSIRVYALFSTFAAVEQAHAFFNVLHQLRVHIANEELLRDVHAKRLLLVNGCEPSAGLTSSTDGL